MLAHPLSFLFILALWENVPNATLNIWCDLFRDLFVCTRISILPTTPSFLRSRWRDHMNCRIIKVTRVECENSLKIFQKRFQHSIVIFTHFKQTQLEAHADVITKIHKLLQAWISTNWCHFFMAGNPIFTRQKWAIYREIFTQFFNKYV